jgi:hypothetical protein
MQVNEIPPITAVLRNKRATLRLWLAFVGGCLTASALTLIGNGRARHDVFEAPGTPAPQTPAPQTVMDGVKQLSIVAYDPDHSKPAERYEIRDGETIVALQSMLVAESKRRVAASTPDPPSYSIQFLPPNVFVGHTETIDVWKTTQGLVWLRSDGTYTVHGDLEIFLHALPARRVVQMLTNGNCNEREMGRRIKKARGEDLVAQLLELCKSENVLLQSAALRNVTSLVRETQPSYEYLHWRIERNQGRAVAAAGAGEIRRVALATLEKALSNRNDASNGERLDLIREAFQCLAETGNQATANELARLLAKETETYESDQLMECLEAIYGLPPSYERLGVCGNSTEEELAAFAEQQAVRQRAGRDLLLQWHSQHGDQDRDAQLDAILVAWRGQLLDLAEARPGFDAYGPIPDRRFLPLLRVGPELVPAIQKRQQKSESLVEQASLEFIRAYQTATCDDPLVDRLLSGEIPQQILACNIIAASGRTDWQARLDRLQYTPYPKDDPDVFRRVQLLRAAATAALLMSTGPEALPLIEAAERAGFDNVQAHAARKFYNMPAQVR